MLKRIVARAAANSFLRHATLLASGTVAANLITLIALPLFSRLYPAESFGLQAILVMGTMALATLGTGYYDWAIPTPKTKKEATGLATLALMLSVALSLLVAVLLVLFGKPLLETLSIETLGSWAWALPPLGLAFASYNIGSYWLLRAGRMASLTQMRFVLPVTNASVSLVLGLKGIEAGLLIGFIVGVFLSSLWSLVLALRSGLVFNAKFDMRALAEKFREFPLYGSIPATAMLLAGQIPLLIITRAYTLEEAGHYAVVRAILYNGTLMVAGATAQIILKHIAEAQRNGEAAWPHFKHMLWLVAGAACALGALFYVVSPPFFRYYLGEAWSDSAAIAQLMAFALPLWLLGVALASAPIALRQLKPIAAWQIGYGVGACFLFTLTDLPFMQLVERVIAFEIIAYAIYIAISVATLRRHGR